MILRRFFHFPPDLSELLRTNFIYLFWDISWWGLYIGATFAFVNIYAARVGATSEQIGLLTALPAAVSLILSLPAGRWLKRKSATRATVVSAFFARMILLAYPLLPWLLPVPLHVNALLVLAVITAIPNTVIGISFNQFFMEAVPIEWRGVIVGTRFALMAIISFITTVISGQILTSVPFPGNYQIVFAIGFVGGIATIYQLAHVRPAAAAPLPLVDLLPAPEVSKTAGRRTLAAQERRYLKVILLLFLFTTSNNIINPLIPNLLVHMLSLSDALISFGTAGSTMLVFLVALFAARITHRTGNRAATGLAAMLLAFQALALAAAKDAGLYLVSAGVAGLSTGLLNTSQFNYHLENVPEAERSTWLSWNQILANAAVLLASLAGPAIAQVSGTPTALLLFGALRFAVGLAIVIWG